MDRNHFTRWAQRAISSSSDRNRSPERRRSPDRYPASEGLQVAHDSGPIHISGGFVPAQAIPDSEGLELVIEPGLERSKKRVEFAEGLELIGAEEEASFNSERGQTLVCSRLQDGSLVVDVDVVELKRLMKNLNRMSRMLYDQPGSSALDLSESERFDMMEDLACSCRIFYTHSPDLLCSDTQQLVRRAHQVWYGKATEESHWAAVNSADLATAIVKSLGSDVRQPRILREGPPEQLKYLVVKLLFCLSSKDIHRIQRALLCNTHWDWNLLMLKAVPLLADTRGPEDLVLQLLTQTKDEPSIRYLSHTASFEAKWNIMLVEMAKRGHILPGPSSRLRDAPFSWATRCPPPGVGSLEVFRHLQSSTQHAVMNLQYLESEELRRPWVSLANGLRGRMHEADIDKARYGKSGTFHIYKATSDTEVMYTIRNEKWPVNAGLSKAFAAYVSLDTRIDHRRGAWASWDRFMTKVFDPASIGPKRTFEGLIHECSTWIGDEKLSSGFFRGGTVLTARSVLNIVNGDIIYLTKCLRRLVWWTRDLKIKPSNELDAIRSGMQATESMLGGVVSTSTHGLPTSPIRRIDSFLLNDLTAIPPWQSYRTTYDHEKGLMIKGLVGRVQQSKCRNDEGRYHCLVSLIVDEVGLNRERPRPWVSITVDSLEGRSAAAHYGKTAEIKVRDVIVFIGRYVAVGKQLSEGDIAYTAPARVHCNMRGYLRLCSNAYVAPGQWSDHHARPRFNWEPRKSDHTEVVFE